MDLNINRSHGQFQTRIWANGNFYLANNQKEITNNFIFGIYNIQQIKKLTQLFKLLLMNIIFSHR